ncbi:MAG: GGDEF domain-containing protein, partial [Anaerolineales bacterium]|nr:sensor domain-containing diguanylate cyclase [Anaerolineales bacterium]MDW8447565.1 GGDEF domain-containing protein [Anaerolineales bacterium]
MRVKDTSESDRIMFEYAPISLWEQDFSGIKLALDGLRAQGIESIEPYLDSHPEFVDECMSRIVVRRVNRKTLELFKAGSQEELLANLDIVFRDEMRRHFRDELVALWEGRTYWTGEGVNYTLEGKPIEIRLHWSIAPQAMDHWDLVLVTLEDITQRKEAERRFCSLFEHSPISLWEEDWSGIKALLDQLRRQGVRNFPLYLKQNPELIQKCMSMLRVINVNQKTVELFKAKSKEELLANLNKVFRDEMAVHFAKELEDMWNGITVYEREGINYALDGEPIYVHIEVRIMPGYEETFGWVLVSLQDITARKKAEDYLRYLGTHDVLTGLHNRMFFEQTLREWEQQPLYPISVIVLDVNGLKTTNDTYGHQAGDELIRRAAEVLQKACEEKDIVARIGGDEFVILLPGRGEK